MGNKYNAKKVVVNNINFDSQAEAEYYLFAKSLLNKGEISDLTLQPQFLLQDGYRVNTNTTKRGIKKISSIKYTPDFMFVQDGKNVVIEVKGFMNDSYKIRKRLFLTMAKRVFNIDTFIEVIKGTQYIYDCASVETLRD